MSDTQGAASIRTLIHELACLEDQVRALQTPVRPGVPGPVDVPRLAELMRREDEVIAVLHRTPTARV